MRATAAAAQPKAMEAEFDPKSLEAGPQQVRLRLDVFVCEAYPQATRSAVRRWIDAGCVKVGGEVRKAGYALRLGDSVDVAPPTPAPLDLEAESIDLSIVFEDEDLAVVDKPSGLVVHPGAGNWSGTLANALLHHFGKVSRSDPIRPGIVHRLDKDTSGLIVVAKCERVHQALAEQFKRRSVVKRYLALVHGRLEDDQGRIDAALGRHPRHRTRMSTSSRNPREALTEYRVLRRFQAATYVRVRLHTGRTHQIRVHFEHIGHPVVGDPLYSANRKGGPAAGHPILKSLNRQFLHAAGLAFVHPTSGSPLSFESALPGELEELLRRLG